MNKRYLHIGFAWKGLNRTAEAQKMIVDPANVDDWFSYGGNCWIVYTKFDQQDWSNHLRHLCGPDDHLVIVELTNLSASNGWLPLKLWDWFKRFRF